MARSSATPKPLVFKAWPRPFQNVNSFRKARCAQCQRGFFRGIFISTVQKSRNKGNSGHALQLQNGLQRLAGDANFFIAGTRFKA